MSRRSNRRRGLGALVALGAAACASGCTGHVPGEALDRVRHAALRLGEHVPSESEIEAVGAIEKPVVRGTPAFARLVKCGGAHIIYKNEEKTGADQMMTPRLCARLTRLAELVEQRWPGLELRVTEAWDENHEHGAHSLHYAGRAADLTTSDVDESKLGELGRLAVRADLGWVFYEDRRHVHVSVRRD
jgi:Hedgehog amino-terminal signalling domain